MDGENEDSENNNEKTDKKSLKKDSNDSESEKEGNKDEGNKDKGESNEDNSEEDEFNFFGVAGDATNIYDDSYDIPEPPTPVGNWIEHLKVVFQDWPTINFWHVGFSGFIAPWEKLENIQSIPLLEMWERLNK